MEPKRNREFSLALSGCARPRGVGAGGASPMSSTRPVETVLCSQDLPLEFRHRSSAHEGDERKVASRVSGIVPARQLDEVICPYLLRRNLLIPAHLGPMGLGSYHAR